jgi:hypothetical protein
MIRPWRSALAVAVTLGLVLSSFGALVAQQPGLPERLTDRKFWELTQTLSEPNGAFQSDNLLSNETGLQKVLPDLTERHPPGGVYLGVGPEQNYTYIAALQPRIAFILDIRRGNRDLHLMYQAIFELAKDRADFVSLLFSRPRPEGLSAETTVGDLFVAFDAIPPSESEYRTNLARLISRLTESHRWPLTPEEHQGIEYVYEKFFRFGPGISYMSSREGRVSPLIAAFHGSYATMMQASDARDAPGSYLSSEARFGIVKDLHARNLIVPVVGDFAGPKALRAIADWLRARRGVVSVFYLSNVEDYLRRGGTWTRFCENAATLPIASGSNFIRSGATAAATPAPPNPSGLTGFAAGGPGDKVLLRYGDGTTRTVTEAEAIKELKVLRVIVPNRLGVIAEETQACR